jgi:propionate CoA-transferase
MRLLDPAAPERAADLIPDGATVAVSGNGAQLVAETLLGGVERAFLHSGRPRDLTLFYPALPGRWTGSGIDHLAHPGLVRAVVASCFRIWDLHRMADLVQADRIEAHCLPMGVGFQLLRAAAAGQPGILSRVGLDTFVDPGPGGGSAFNRVRPSRTWVSRVDVDGEPHLYYRSPPVDVAILKATAADREGNLSLAGEPIRQAALDMAMAARARGGRVLAEARYLVRSGSLAPDRIAVPGFLVDAVLPQADPAPPPDPAMSGDWQVEASSVALPLSVRKVMARRIALLFTPGQLVNLGFGLPGLVGDVLAEEGVAEAVRLSVEHGPVGGRPTGKDAFGGAVGPRYLFTSPDTFTLYHGGNLDWAVLGAAEVDGAGNVAVHRFGRAIPGPGGFVDIAASARRLVFAAPLTTGGTVVDLLPEPDVGLRVAREGQVRKFVPHLRERTFSARQALRRGAEVWYVTDRATFRLTADGPLLTEVAPGVDLQRDVLDRMGFQPAVAQPLRQWPACLFRHEPMGLAARWADR